MKAIQDIRRYLNDHADTPSAELLSRLPVTLSREGTLALSDLYDLDWESFELAIELLRDWRIDRYYAGQLDLVSVRSDEQLELVPVPVRRDLPTDAPVAAE